MKQNPHRFRTLTRAIALALCVVCLLTTVAAWAQIPTGTVTGKVTSDGQPLPGVSVTAKSPRLQGSRTVVTSGAGDYAIVNLPPGDYTLEFSISGFKTLTKPAVIAAAQSVSLDAAMSLTEITAEATVVAKGEQISETAMQSTTYTSDILNKLPVTRTLLSAVVLSPGVNTNGPNGAVTISGGQSFDNNILVNGVNIQDNIRGTPFNLFIEDAIQETTTSTSGISAEYGRFQGGVINTITKSGGNAFSGSYRMTLTNNAWAATNPAPFNTPGAQSVTPTSEATLGGPIWKDHVWFFGALRYPKATSTATTLSSPPASEVYPPGSTYTPPTYTFTDLEKRYEGKLTLTPFQNHTLTGSYIRIDREQTNTRFTPLAQFDLDSVYNRSLPQELYTGNYNGVITDKFFVEAQYSQRKFTFVGDGSQFTDLVKGTVMHDLGSGGYYNSPIFCAVCPGANEERNNEDFLIKGTYFLSTPSIGSHNIVLGFDDFAGKRLSNNYQSGSGYFISTTGAIFKGGDIFPVVDEGSYLGYYPIPNLASPSDNRTYSVFLNDAWKLNNNLSFNIGVRWDKNNAKDSRGAVTAKDSKFSPRLAVTFDPTATGKVRFNASYARYVGAIQETQTGAASSFGNPAYYDYYYEGPAINTDPTKPLLTRAQVLQAMFAWFGITAPGQFPKASIQPFAVGVPGVNTQIRDGLNSPHTDEITVGVAGNVGPTFNFRVDGVYRKASDFYATVTDRSTGTVQDALGNTFDLGIVQNVNDQLSRKYYGLNVQFAFRPFTALNLGGNWTWAHTYGNFVGETSGSGPVGAAITQYPEYKNIVWNAPNGDLSQDQRHRVRVFATFDLPVPKMVGNLSVSAIQSYDTGLPYGAVGAVRSARYVTNPGYALPPSSVAYYFTSRDAFRTDNVSRTDFALNFSRNIGPLEIFMQPQVLNVFNNHAIASNESSLISTRVQDRTNNTRLSDFNPFTATPVEYDKSKNNGNCPNAASGPTTANFCIPAAFGTASSANAYQLPRTFRVSFGVRF